MVSAAKPSVLPMTSAHTASGHGKAALPMMQGRKAALLTLSYLGAIRTMPHYNVMGMAKASLEASVRYLAMQLDARGYAPTGISAGRSRHWPRPGIGDFSNCSATTRSTHRSNATSLSKKSATRRPSCAAIWPAASPARSLCRWRLQHHRIRHH